MRLLALVFSIFLACSTAAAAQPKVVLRCEGETHFYGGGSTTWDNQVLIFDLDAKLKFDNAESEGTAIVRLRSWRRSRRQAKSSSSNLLNRRLLKRSTGRVKRSPVSLAASP
jgi:hypothetical protein